MPLDNPFSNATGFQVFDLNAGGALINSGTFDNIVSNTALPGSSLTSAFSGLIPTPTADPRKAALGVFPGGSNPEGIGTPLDKNLSNQNATTGSVVDWLNGFFTSDLLYRGVLIFLGMIFIAAGLYMFGTKR